MVIKHSQENNLCPKHILIVDDKPTNLKVLAETLTKAGFEIAIANNGTMAIEMIQEDPPELILLDILMPEMDGFETFTQINSNFQIEKIPIIFMSALTDTEDKVKGLSLGAADYITKPFETEEVLARVRTQLQMRLLGKNLQQKNQELSEALIRLEKSQQKLIAQEKLAVIGSLTAGIVHELRNPLNFIKNFGEGSIELSDDLQAEIQKQSHNINTEPFHYIQELVEDLKENALTITSHSKRAENVIDDMLLQSKNGHSHKPELDHLHTLINQALNLVSKSDLNFSRVKISKDYDRQIEKIMMIREQISRVFINLFDNAFYALKVKEQESATQEIPFVPQLNISTKKIEHYVEISITDNGIGIPMAIQEKIFHPFFSTKANDKGTGLGLSLCKDIVVNNHNGMITVKSEPRQNTELKIILPDCQSIEDKQECFES